MDFSKALAAVKRGARASRSGWNGKGMFIFLVPGSRFTVNREPLLSILGEGTPVSYNPHIDIKNSNGTISTWVPSIGDVMADDWEISGPGSKMLDAPTLDIPAPLFGPSLAGMGTFVGVKVIHAAKMVRGDYCAFRNWPVPDDENPNDAGYLVEYSDKVQDPPTMPGFKGYVSWSPADVFEAAYSEYRSTARKDEIEREMGEPFTRENDPDAPLTFSD